LKGSIPEKTPKMLERCYGNAGENAREMLAKMLIPTARC